MIGFLHFGHTQPPAATTRAAHLNGGRGFDRARLDAGLDRRMSI